MFKNIGIIIGREYYQRVHRKSFIISTLLMPIVLVALMALPALIMIMAEPDNNRIAVIDRSGVVLPALAGNEEMTFVPTDLSLDSAKVSEDYDAVLVIGPDIITNPSNVQIYTHNAMSMPTSQVISQQIASAVESKRLEKYNIANLDKIMAEVKADVTLREFRLEDGEETESSSIASYAISLITMMILYMFILMYGQMVMTSIIEEKNNRVLEVVVSSVRPTALMMGKISGIGLVALTQMVIWGIIIYAFTAFGMPLLISDMSGGADMDAMAAIQSIGNVGYMMSIFATMTLLMLLGYLFYASIYAAIGAAVDNIQDASQLQTFAIVPIIASLIFGMGACTDPNSAMSFWMSMIPLTSPMVMMARVPAGVPGWELALSLAILAVFTVLTIWLSAKIYRVGIFMYGKKPTPRDLIRWARYK
ncbi:MAG: ABC transporter permease [Bacteroidales bacterium]|nr:ABC transporter permease [Bacteroidales bacterium]MDY2917509.1 ABC transporter permease [Muribaculaceae bacterium]